MHTTHHGDAKQHMVVSAFQWFLCTPVGNVEIMGLTQACAHENSAATTAMDFLDHSRGSIEAVNRTHGNDSTLSNAHTTHARPHIHMHARTYQNGRITGKNNTVVSAKSKAKSTRV